MHSRGIPGIRVAIIGLWSQNRPKRHIATLTMYNKDMTISILHWAHWWGGRKVGCASTCRRPSALEHGSDRHETWPKRVSDDPRQFNFRRKQKKSARFFGLGNRFSPFWAGFEASSEKRTSKSTSWQFFALDGPILSSVRPKIDKNMSVGALRSVMRRRPPHLSPTPPMRSA